MTSVYMAMFAADCERENKLKKIQEATGGKKNVPVLLQILGAYRDKADQSRFVFCRNMQKKRDENSICFSLWGEELYPHACDDGEKRFRWSPQKIIAADFQRIGAIYQVTDMLKEPKVSEKKFQELTNKLAGS